MTEYAEYKDKKILVTGAGGFIGRHLCERLIDAGAELTAFVWERLKENDNLLLRELPKEKIGKIRIHRGDLRDRKSLVGIVKGIDAVFHLAAITSVPYSFEHPAEVFDININGLLNLLLAARENRLKRVVAASTAAVYGPPSYLPVDENHRISPRSPYAASKAAGDEIALSFFHSFGLSVVILRLFNTFGPGQTMRALVPNIILQAIKDRRVKLGRTDSVRDFNYIANVVDGFLAAGLKEDIGGGVFNLGSGREYSVQDVLDGAADLLGTSLDIIIEEKRKRPSESDVNRLCPSIKKARKILGYDPAVSFHEGLRRTFEYYVRQADYYYRQ